MLPQYKRPGVEALELDAGLYREAKARSFIIIPLLITVSISVAMYKFREGIMQELLPGPSIWAGGNDVTATEEPYVLDSEWYDFTQEPEYSTAEATPGPTSADRWFPEPGAESEHEDMDPLGEAELSPGVDSEAEAEPVSEPQGPASSGSPDRALRREGPAAGGSPAYDASPPAPEPEAVSAPPPIARRGLVSRSSKGNGSPPSADSSESEPVYFEINDATSGFLGNLGLAFSLVYAFVFARSYQRFDSMMSVFYAEVAAIHKLVLLVQTVQLPRPAVVTMVNSLR